MTILSKPLTLLGLLGVVAAVWVEPATLDACPGYKATNVKSDGSTMTADLSLAGEACNVFGTDIQQLTLQVTYETGTAFYLRRGSPHWLTVSALRHSDSPQDRRPGCETVRSPGLGCSASTFETDQDARNRI